MKELFQGRRFGFAPRPAISYIAVGMGIALTLADLMSWFAWGSRETNGFYIVAYWLSLAVTVALAIAAFAALAESVDAPREDRGFVRLDVLALLAAFLLYAASALLRSLDVSLAAAQPAPFLLAIAALLVTLADAAVAANLYSAREWAELEEEPVRDRRPRRRAASR